MAGGSHLHKQVYRRAIEAETENERLLQCAYLESEIIAAFDKT